MTCQPLVLPKLDDESNAFIDEFDFYHRVSKNMGTFNNHYMDKDSEEIFYRYAGLNAVDTHAYPELLEVKKYCGEFILKLFHADELKNYRYFSTSGSSESIFLSLVSMKEKWRSLQTKKNIRPNFIISANAHVAWQKAAQYLDIELRIMPLNENLLMDSDHLLEYVDSNTIGINCTLGSQTTLLFDNVNQFNTILKVYFLKTRHFIPIHVDAASGGFVAPFSAPDLLWDFRLNHVISINVSGHKYGMVYPSIGWLLVRKETYLESDLAHENSYLGGQMKRFAIHFSHSASHMMAQCHLFRTLGRSGYKKAIQNLFELNKLLINGLEENLEIKLIEVTHTSRLPGVIFTLDNPRKSFNKIIWHMKKKGWIIPTFNLPRGEQSIEVGRIVIRYGMDKNLILNFIDDINNALNITVEETVNNSN